MNKFLAVIFIVLALLCQATAAEKTIPVPKIGSLKLDAPATWKYFTTADRTVTVSFFPKPKSYDEVTLSFIPNDPAIKDFTGTPAIKKILEDGIKYSLNNIEGNFILKEIGDKGYYYSVAYIKPMYGEPKHLTRGGVVCGRYFLMFSVRSETFDEKIVEQAIKMVKSATISQSKKRD